MPAWDAELYLRFANERTQPAVDLTARIQLANPARIIDLGCGPGNSTQILRQRWPAADITGLDSSAEMIAAAEKNYPAGKWLVQDIVAWSGADTFDIVFSNAVLHWLPEHEVVFPRLFKRVSPGGVLAVQMPAHLESPLHRLILEIAGLPQWRERLQRARSAIAGHTPGFYYDMLQPLAASVVLWQTEYQHVMNGSEAILDWIRGTGLRPFIEALEDRAEQQRFEATLLAGIERTYPRQADGRILFPFRRLFMVACRR